MSRNVPSSQLFGFLVADFQRAWDAMAATDSAEALRDADPEAGGNFLFARQAMSLLELVCRVAQNEKSGSSLNDFSRALGEVEPLYFGGLPGTVPLPRDFRLPSWGAAPSDEQLLAAIYDLVRHGQSHQYQQIPVDLDDGGTFEIALTGAEQGRPIREVRREQAMGVRRDHLAFRRHASGLTMVVRPERLFLDFMDAARRASVFAGGFDVEYLSRPRHDRDSHYRFSSDALERRLREADYPCRG